MGLSATDLTVTLGGRRVLDGVSAAFAAGRVTAVLGANGAGKSTLLRALAALIPVRGVTLDGAAVTAMPPRERARAIGYLPQDPAVHWNMAAREVVALGRLPHGDRDTAAIDAALAATDASAFATRPVRELSGGERARVLLARVVAGEPRWLLADEPLASLDPAHQRHVLTVLRAVAAQGAGVVMVLHDLTLAAQAADDVLLLKQGRVLAFGAAVDVLTAENIAAAYGVNVAIIAHRGAHVIVPDLMI